MRCGRKSLGYRQARSSMYIRVHTYVFNYSFAVIKLAENCLLLLFLFSLCPFINIYLTSLNLIDLLHARAGASLGVERGPVSGQRIGESQANENR